MGKANLLVELLLLRSGVLTFSSSWFSLEQVNSLVEYVTWYYSFVFLFFFSIIWLLYSWFAVTVCLFYLHLSHSN